MAESPKFIKPPRQPARLLLVLLGALVLFRGALAAEKFPAPWENRLQGNAIVLLGETHDNAVQHRLRLQVLQRAFKAGWRPAIVMEQFDREHQADMDRARRERPRDPRYLIERAAPAQDKPGGGWNWDFYRPYVALALQYEVPLFAGNLSRADAGRIVAQGYGAVFDEATVQRLGLETGTPVRLEAQESAIDAGHCHSLPKDLLPSMARAQLARDAVMASILQDNAARGVVLLAGNGHVRRDIGVPSWIDPDRRESVFAVGFLEEDDEDDNDTPAAAFDAIVRTAAAARPDPCAALRHRSRPEAPRNQDRNP